MEQTYQQSRVLAEPSVLENLEDAVVKAAMVKAQAKQQANDAMKANAAMSPWAVNEGLAKQGYMSDASSSLHRLGKQQDYFSTLN